MHQTLGRSCYCSPAGEQFPPHACILLSFIEQIELSSSCEWGWGMECVRRKGFCKICKNISQHMYVFSNNVLSLAWMASR
jgi:hypothetical protein